MHSERVAGTPDELPRTTVRDNDAPESDGPDGRPGLRVRGRLRPCRNDRPCKADGKKDGNATNREEGGNANNREEARNTGSNREATGSTGEATGSTGEATGSTEATGKGTTGTTEVA